MRFDLENSELVYEVKYKRPDCEESYSYEYLYRDKCGRYFMHFEGGAYSKYSVKTGYIKSAPRSGNYYIDKSEINLWKEVTKDMQKQYPDYYEITNWRKERDDTFLNNEVYIGEAELPF